MTTQKKISNLLSHSGLCALAISAFAVGPQVGAQEVAYERGDLVVGFQATGGIGAAETFVFNIGSSTDLRDGVITGDLINLNTVLSATYGSGWFTRADLYWGVAGVRNNANPQPPFGTVPEVVDGDPSATVYISKAATVPGSSSPWTGYSRAATVSAANNIAGLLYSPSTGAQGAFRHQPAAPDTDGRGALIAASGTNSWATNNPVPGGAAFQVLTGGVSGGFGGSGDFVYLDVYRMLASTNGAEPTGTVGEGSLAFTLAIAADGNLSVVGESSWFEGPGVTVFEDGWRMINWFGYLFKFDETSEGWHFHLEHGFQYAAEGNGGLWLYDLALEAWIWSSSTAYPWLYAAEADAWLYFVEDTFTPERSFYTTTGDLVSEADL